MFAQFGVEGGGQGAFGAGGDIGFDVTDFAHAGDDGGDVFVVEDEAEGHFGMVMPSLRRGLSASAWATLVLRFSATK